MSAISPEHPSADPTSVALESLLARYGALMRLAGVRRGLATGEFDDLLQEVRLRLWRAERRGENLTALPASYLYRTASSAAVDMLRRQRSRREDTLELARDRPVSGRDDPAAAMQSQELGAAIAKALQTLPASRRPVVRMYLAGYARDEIAALLGWTDAKIRNLLYRGLEDVRSALRTMGYTPQGDRHDR